MPSQPELLPTLSSAELGSIARARREELGLTRTTLAERTGTTRRWIREFEHGKSTAQIGVIYRLMTALRLTIAILPADSDAASIDLDVLLGGFDA